MPVVLPQNEYVDVKLVVEHMEPLLASLLVINMVKLGSELLVNVKRWWYAQGLTMFFGSLLQMMVLAMLMYPTSCMPSSHQRPLKLTEGKGT